MKMNEVINSDMVVLAREYRGLTQEQLARKIRSSQGKVAKIEGGLLTELPESTIELISKTLEFPREFFFQDEQRLGFGSSAYFYRKKAKLSATDRRRITALVNLSRISIKRLLSTVDIEPSRELPYYDIEDHDGDAIAVAKKLRGIWNLPDGPVKNITALIESAGILVIPCDFGTDAMDATSVDLAELPPIIFINNKIPGDRWRFTLAHELGHIVMHKVNRETMEDEADAFASEMLMPSAEMKAQFMRMGKVRIQDLANIKPYWKVSIAALIMKARSLGALTENQNRYLWMQMSRMGYRKHEPNPLPKEKVQNYLNLFGYYRNQLDYSIEDIATVSILPRPVLESLHAYGLPQDERRKAGLRVV